MINVHPCFNFSTYKRAEGSPGRLTLTVRLVFSEGIMFIRRNNVTSVGNKVGRKPGC